MDSFPLQPAIGQPESQTLTGDSPSPFEDVDLALLRFVRYLIRIGLTLEEARVVIAGEVERFRTGATNRPRRVLVGTRWLTV
ncbi:hypothetical protein [Bradyrhizobium erythrophlei]|uniref:hypothetical protein n=1 Tax=Bradyrhizobium erythrophlei TaxID=1437360 RepID=UPI0012ABCD24|nr:hypothetical protein [Bradyrhizobium erythrophlei]